MTGVLFEIRDLIHRYNGRIVLEEPFLALESGTITGISGPNGSGKSTLINIMGLIIKPSQGTLTFNGEKVEPFSHRAKGRIATLTQDASLLNRSVGDNVAFGLMEIRNRKNRSKRVNEALEAVGLSSSFVERNAKTLSGGEARRVALAARLAMRPEVLLLDEPTAHVDEHSNAMIRRAVLQARDMWSTTLLISSHDREWLESISDQAFTVFKGRIYKEERINILTVSFEKKRESLENPCPENDNRLPLPPVPESGLTSAILPASALHLAIEPGPIPPHAMRFNTMVVGMFFSARGHRLYATLASHDTLLSSLVPPSKAGVFKPGQSVYAFYDPRDLMFV